MPVDLVFKLQRTGDGALLAFELSSREVRNGVWDFVNRAGKKTNDHFRVRVDVPARPITRGYRSQMNRLWGHAQEIADQLSSDDRVYTKEEIEVAFRRMAVSEGLRTQLSIDGEEEPIHLSSMTVEDANIVERVKQRFCDLNNLFVTEYDMTTKPPTPYKTIGGRTREEMRIYWHEQTKRNAP